MLFTDRYIVEAGQYNVFLNRVLVAIEYGFGAFDAFNRRKDFLLQLRNCGCLFLL